MASAPPHLMLLPLQMQRRTGTGRETTKRPMPITFDYCNPNKQELNSQTSCSSHQAQEISPPTPNRRSMGTSPTFPHQPDRHSMGTSPILPRLLRQNQDACDTMPSPVPEDFFQTQDDFGGGFDEGLGYDGVDAPSPAHKEEDVLSAKINLKEHLAASASKTAKAKSKTAARKRKTSLDKIGRLPDEVLERCVDDDSGKRRSRRNRTAPLEWWRNERQEYGRRDSAKFAVPVAVITQPKESTPTWVRRARERYAAAEDAERKVKRSKKMQQVPA